MVDGRLMLLITCMVVYSMRGTYLLAQNLAPLLVPQCIILSLMELHWVDCFDILFWSTDLSIAAIERTREDRTKDQTDSTRDLGKFARRGRAATVRAPFEVPSPSSSNEHAASKCFPTLYRSPRRTGEADRWWDAIRARSDVAKNELRREVSIHFAQARLFHGRGYAYWIVRINIK